MRISAVIGLLQAAVLAGLVLCGPALAQQARPVPLSPQPAAADLRPGIAVSYYYNFVRHVDEIRRWMGYKEGIPGDPIAQLNFDVGETPVLTSKRTTGVGAHMTGVILLDQAGTYAFAASSNDGFELSIGGALILQDPDVHATRMSEVAQLEIVEPGWYALELVYFQRKGTAALELFWRPPGKPGDKAMQHVPAEVFAHLPEGG